MLNFIIVILLMVKYCAKSKIQQFNFKFPP